MIRILLVDDHPVVREGVAAILSDEPDFEVVGEAESAADTLRKVALLHPDVVVLDLRLPDSEDAEACTTLIRRHPGLKILVLTTLADEGTMLATLGAGARGFLVKESKTFALRLAVRFVAEGGIFVDPRMAGRLVDLATRRQFARGPFGLTPQEMRVLRLIPQGLTNREIARDLGISEQTVKTHVRHALRKLGAADRAKAAAIAQREGLT